MAIDEAIEAKSEEVSDEPIAADGAMVALVSKAEIDMQIATAKRFPRDIKKFITDSTSLASMDQDVAGECYYRLEREDKKTHEIKIIEGPSSRLAEIVASSWGNCRAAARVIEENDRFVVAQGAFIDLERNVAITYETRRRITNKFGKRFSDDMIGVTANAACSIALRNAVFKGIPKAFWQKSYERAVETYRGDAKSLVQKRSVWQTYWKKLGVSDDAVLAKIQKASWEAVDLDDMVRFRGFATALKEGDTTLEECFPSPQASEPETAPRAGSKADQVAAELEQEKRSAPTAAASTPSPDSHTADGSPRPREPGEDEEPATGGRPKAEQDDDILLTEWLDEIKNASTKRKIEELKKQIETVPASIRTVVAGRLSAKEAEITASHGERSNSR